MAGQNGENQGNYKVPNQAAGFVKAPNTIVKQGASPQKTTGGDLRTGKSGK